MRCLFHKWSEWRIEEIQLAGGAGKPLAQIRHCVKCKYSQIETFMVKVPRNV